MDQVRQQTLRRRAKWRFRVAAAISASVLAVYIASAFVSCHYMPPSFTSVGYSFNVGYGKVGVYRMEDEGNQQHSLTVFTRWDTRPPDWPSWEFNWWFRCEIGRPWSVIFIPLWL